MGAICVKQCQAMFVSIYSAKLFRHSTMLTKQFWTEKPDPNRKHTYIHYTTIVTAISSFNERASQQQNMTLPPMMYLQRNTLLFLIVKLW